MIGEKSGHAKIDRWEVEEAGISEDGSTKLRTKERKRNVGVITHKYRGSIVVHSISKSVEPNEEQKEMTNGFQ